MNRSRLTVNVKDFRKKIRERVKRLSGRVARRALRAAARREVLPSVKRESPVVTGAMVGSWIIRNVRPASLPKGVIAVDVANDGKTVFMVRNRFGKMKRKTERGIRQIRARTVKQRRLLAEQERLLAQVDGSERRKIKRRAMRLEDHVRFLRQQVRRRVRRSPHLYSRKVNISKKSFGFFDRAIRKSSLPYRRAVKLEIRKVIR